MSIPQINSKRYLQTENIPGEVWKDIIGYEDTHQVSNYGRVRTKDRIVKYTNGKVYCYRSKILRVRVNKSGYCVVFLSNKRYLKSESSKRLHQVVLSAFVSKPKNCNQINHKDENKQNNVLSNLEWCDAKYNVNYGTRAERFRQKVINDPRRSKKVRQISISGELVRIFPSLNQISREYGYKPVHIREVCTGKLKSAYGYRWEWMENQS